MIIGLSSGGVALALTIVLIIVFAGGGNSGDSDPATDNTPQIDPQEQERIKRATEEKTLRAHREWLKNELNRSDYNLVWERYQDISTLKIESSDLESRRKDLLADAAKALGKSADGNVPIKMHREIVDRLQKDKFKKPAIAIATMVCGNSDEGAGYQRTIDKTTHDKDGNPIRSTKEDPDFKEMMKIAGFIEYKIPEEINKDYIIGFKEYLELEKEASILETTFPKGVYPPEETEYLKTYEDKVREIVEEIEAKAEQGDKFAVHAAAAFSRFRNRYRGSDKFGDEFTYDYAEPYVFFLELEEDSDPEAIKESLTKKKKILQDLAKFFKKNFRDKWGLIRKYPKGVTAENKDTWPLEIVVLPNDERYQQYLINTIGPMPGARAHYSPTFRQVITWDDPASEYDKEREWFDRSVLIHEAWHFISSIHMDDPKSFMLEDEQTGDSIKIPLPNYSSLVVQEGLTDFVAGFAVEEGSGNYLFRQINHLRLRDLQGLTKFVTENIWKATCDQYKELGVEIPENMPQYEEGKYMSIFDMRALLMCYHYGSIGGMMRDYFSRIGMGGNPWVFAVSQSGYPKGAFYAQSALASYFFHYYEDGKYRDAYYEWCRKDYTGKISKKINIQPNGSYESEKLPGLLQFMKEFGIKDLEDPKWDEMDEAFTKYYMDVLVAKNVGTGGFEVPKGSGGDPGAGGGEGYWMPGGSFNFRPLSKAGYARLVRQIRDRITGSNNSMPTAREDRSHPRAPFPSPGQSSGRFLRDGRFAALRGEEKAAH